MTIGKRLQLSTWGNLQKSFLLALIRCVFSNGAVRLQRDVWLMAGEVEAGVIELVDVSGKRRASGADRAPVA
jgi:hypothetical protein